MWPASRIAGGMKGREAVAERVLVVTVGVRPDEPVENLLRLELVTGGRAGMEQFGEEGRSLVGFGHK